MNTECFSFSRLSYGNDLIPHHTPYTSKWMKLSLENIKKKKILQSHFAAPGGKHEILIHLNLKRIKYFYSQFITLAQAGKSSDTSYSIFSWVHSFGGIDDVWHEDIQRLIFDLLFIMKYCANTIALIFKRLIQLHSLQVPHNGYYW